MPALKVLRTFANFVQNYCIEGIKTLNGAIGILSQRLTSMAATMNNLQNQFNELVENKETEGDNINKTK